MENLLLQLFALSNLIFCLMVWVLVWAQRKVIAMVWKGAETNKWYREILLPLGPIGTGGLLGAFVSEFPYPEGFTSLAARVFYGVVCGLLSAHVYKMVKGFVNKHKEEIAANATPDELEG